MKATMADSTVKLCPSLKQARNLELNPVPGVVTWIQLKKCKRKSFHGRNGKLISTHLLYVSDLHVMCVKTGKQVDVEIPPSFCEGDSPKIDGAPLLLTKGSAGKEATLKDYAMQVKLDHHAELSSAGW